MKLLVYEHAKIDIEEGDFKHIFKLGLILNIKLYVYRNMQSAMNKENKNRHSVVTLPKPH